MDYEHNILQGEAKSTEFSDDRSYLLVQKANSHCACVGQTEECCLPKIVLTYDFSSLLYTCLDRCVSRWLALKSHYAKASQKKRGTILIAGGWILLRRVRCACDGSSHPHCCGQLCQLLQQAGVSTRVMMMLRQILSPYWKQNNRWLNTRNDLKLISRRGKLRSRERPPQGGFIFLLYCLYHSITL